MVSQDLLDILRCPVCVHNEPEGGELLVTGNWLICRDCDRKYPVRDDIPVMLIHEGDRFRSVPAGQLPDIPPAEETHPGPSVPPACREPADSLVLYLLLALVGAITAVVLIRLVRRRRSG